MSIAEKNLKIKSSKLMNSLFLGNFKTAFSGKGIEFQDFREYSYGDDAKYIDWSASSREQTTILRRYREEKQGNILSVLDIRESLLFGEGEKKEVYKNILHTLYYACKASGESFGGYSIEKNENVFITSTKTPIALESLRKLSENYRNNSDALDLDFLCRKSLKRSVIFVVSDSMNIHEKNFKVACMKHDLVYIHVSSVFENTLESKGLISLRSKGSELSIDLSDTGKKELYILKRNEKLSLFRKKLKNLGADSIFLDEHSCIESEFIKCMKSR